MGASYDKNLAIIKAHKEGIVTSASIMPTSAYFEEAVEMCKENPALAAGIHITVLATRERPVLSPEEVPSIVTPKGFFYENAEQLLNANPSTEEIEKEVRAQIKKFRESGLHFVYLDHHRGVPQIVQDIIYKLCQEQQLIYGQVRDGSVYGYERVGLLPEHWPLMELPDGNSVLYAAPALNEEQRESFFDALAGLKPGKWLTVEHPGLVDPERASVTELMCHPRTKEIIKKKNIQLVSYYDLWEEEFGTPEKEPIRLLVRGDDMGVNHDVVLATIKAYREGILTSASIMPTSAYFEEAVRLCRENPGLAAGLHLTLLGTRERPVLSPEKVPSLVRPNGFFYETLDQLEEAGPDPEEIEKEVRAQIGKARASGLHFVYLDWHRGVSKTTEEIIIRICKEQRLIYGQVEEAGNGTVYGYPRLKLVHESWPSKELPDGRIVYYAAPALNEEEQQSFFVALSGLSPGQWLTVVHPGLADPQRASVTGLLCAPETMEIIRKKNIQLVSYYDLWEEEYGKSKSQ
jgi:predicted glycoside hydrolase/deacetylase ChbG (UPF0249 family)